MPASSMTPETQVGARRLTLIAVVLAFTFLLLRAATAAFTSAPLLLGGRVFGPPATPKAPLELNRTARAVRAAAAV